MDNPAFLELIQRWNDTATDYPRGRCIHELFEERAEQTPTAAALLFGDEIITYGDLNRRANGLAHRLRAEGVGDNDLVGLCADRSVEQLVGILAILKAGAAYVPLDPSYPAERLGFMLKDTGVKVLLAHRHVMGAFPAQGVVAMWLDAADLPAPVDENLHSGATAESLAYVIYTSGSTGTPKGVMVPHRAVVRLVCNTNYADLSDSQVYLQLAPISFDASTLEIWAPLLGGGRLAIMAPGTPTPEAIGAAIRRYGVTTLWLTASLFHLMVDGHLDELQPLQQLLAGGDVLSVAHVRKVRREMAHCRLINGYGPTENTTFTCCHTIDSDIHGSVPIGRPIANTQVYVLDADRQPVPVGVEGELYAGGDGLALGYLNRPDLTAERFVATQFGRLYRTGDRVRWEADGTITFLGRFDSQVKIRGFRIEPGEIESVLGAHPGVGECVVIAREARPGDKRLVAYVVSALGDLSAAQLRAYLQDRLPAYMIPSAIVMLDAMPLSPNGKVDRQALPEPASSEAYVAPQTPLEEMLAEIWREVLGVARVSIHDSFFELGGHSLLATRITSRVRAALGVELQVHSLFAAPTVAELALLIGDARADEQAPPLVAVPRPSRHGPLPLSFAQERLWFLDQLEPGSPFYNIPAAWSVTGRLELPVLERSLEALVARHEALRTTFADRAGEPVQLISEAAAVPVVVTDLSDLAQADREAELHRVLSQEATRPFDLRTGPLLRVLLVRLAPEAHVLMLNMHHIVSDGWSMGVLLAELSALYAAFAEGQPSPLAPLPIQYADFARWQRQWLEGGEADRQLAYWKERMAGAPALLELPTDRPRPPVQSHRGALLPVGLPADLAGGLAALGRQEGATLFMTLLAGFQALLARYSGQTDIVVGCPVAGRNRAETEALIGFFVGTLPHRTDLAGNPSFRELLVRVRAGALGGYAHQDLPLQRLVEELQPERNLSHSPLFQVVFALQNAPGAGQEPHGLTFAPVTIDTETAKFDLAISLEETAAGLTGTFEYNTDLFDRTTVERIAAHFQRLLAAAVASPDQPVAALDLLSDTERHQLLVEWNATERDYPVTTLIHELVAARAAERPERVAVVCGGERLTYGELDRRSTQLAHYLRRMGVGPEQLVGVCTDRSPEMLVALLGVLKAGAAYLPIDPAYPRERIAYMLADAQAVALLTQARLLGHLPEQVLPVLCLDRDWAAVAGESPEAPAQLAGPENLAYVIYTSGSTGRPKGVMVEHRSLLNLVCWHQRTFGLTAADRTTQTAGVAFDATVWEIWPALAAGATLYLPDEETRLTPARLRDWLVANEITVSFLATPLAEQLLALDWPAGTALRLLLTGGDKLHIYPPAGLPFQLVNCYGPTESTVVSTAGMVPVEAGQQAAPSIGWPIANTRAYLLDHQHQPVPIGVTGELYVGGSSLARGYLNRPDLTAERFVETPFGRLYRTGDLARRLPDGALAFMGRSDDQVKIRGFRIELSEIETVLKLADGVQVALVLAREEQPGRKQLVAYVVPAEGRRVSRDALRAFLKAYLPDYMVPAAFVVLHQLPLTPNGKVDRRALPVPEEHGSSEAYVAPRTATEANLAAIWREVLGLNRVGIYDNFFELGGHSLLATRVISRIGTAFGVELPVRSLFATPTVAGLAAVVAEAQRDERMAPILPQPREGALPLTLAQERLWFLDQLDPSSPLYNVPVAWRVTGLLDVPVLERSLSELTRRHESLRTTFVSQDGKPVQVIHPAAAVPVALTDLTDLTGLTPADREAELQRILRREAVRPFDLAAGPLLRVLLVRLAPDAHVLLLNMHHIVTDGWSMNVLLDDLSALYGAFADQQVSPLAPLPVQVADYALWQRQGLAGGEMERQLAYWKERMAGAPALLELPTDRPRPPVQSYRGALLSVDLPAELAEGLAVLSRQEGATLFMTLLAGFQALLARYSGQTDVVVGAPVAGRSRAEVEGLIGFFVGTLLHRTDLSGDPTFRELLARVRDGALGAFAHQDLDFQRLVEELQPERTLSHSPLFQVMFTLENAALTQSLDGLTFAPVTIDPGTAKFDLTLSLKETATGLTGTFEYNTDLFDRTTVERMAAHLQRLLAAAVASPDQPVAALDLLSDTERHQLLVDWNATESDYPVTILIHELVTARAAERPESVAVVCGGERLTYGELDRRSTQLAHYLRRMGVGPEQLVGVCTDRSPEMLVALLGVLKAGAAYLPIDPAYPRERIAYMLADAQAVALLTQARLLGHLPEQGFPVLCLDRDWAAVAGESPEAPAQLAGPENLAYVIYTSGSTGRPKGVMVEHRSLLNLVCWHQRTFGLTAADRTTQTAGVAFDATVWEIWPALAAGATLYLPDEETRLTPARLRDWLVANEITVSFLATPLAEQMLALDWPAGTALRLLLTGGDKLHIYPPAGLPFQLVNCYGPTESTVVATAGMVPVEAGQQAAPSIGQPIANTRAYLLDHQHQPVPIGVTGELYVGGSSLARGYLNRPDLTAERFVETPFGRLYRTGDLACRLPDGALAFMGRSDDQVKIRGFRIELGEIETTLKLAEGVQAAAVIVREDQPGRRQLVAYVVPDEGRQVVSDALRSFLQKQLPDYMVPAAFVLLPALPLTPNGKVDRKALPAPEGGADANEYVAPRTPREEIMAGIWCEVLGVSRVGVHDSFFELGGHSLLATRLTSRIRTVFGAELPVRSLFAAPTVAGLVAQIEGAQQNQLPQVAPVPHEGPLPLSFAQQRLWFLDQLEPGSPFYNIPVAWRVTGRLELPVLERSLAELAAGHESLRTTFVSQDGKPVQVIHPATGVPVALTDLTALDPADREAELQRILRREAVRPFDLAAGPLLRVLLVRLSPDEHLLMCNVHHIIADGWSMGVLLQELTALYGAFAEGQPSPLAPLPVQYADFALWQRDCLEKGELQRQLAYWKTRMAGAPAVLELPTDRPRPAVQSFRGAVLPLKLPGSLAKRLGALSRQEGATLFMTLLASFQVLLARYSGQTDIVVGSPVAGRSRAELEGLIGFFVNTLLHRTDLSGAPTFRELLARVREGSLGALDHQDVAFQHLVEELQPQRTLSHAPLFQVMFSMESMPVGLHAQHGLTFAPFVVGHDTSKFDLTLSVQETDDGIVGALEYSTDLFDAATIERLAGHFATLLEGIAANPDAPVDALPLLTEAESHRLLTEWNATQRDYRTGLLISQLFEEQVARTPDAAALVCGRERISYRELNDRANRLAAYLRELGAGPDGLVGVCLDRTAEMVVALLGVLKAGGAYVPLDPAYPRERLAVIAEEAQVKLLLTRQQFAGLVTAPNARVVAIDTEWAEIAGRSGENAPSAALETNLAYVIYTSGSTGRPKGVAITHASAVTFIHWALETFAPRELAGVLFSTSICFDLSIFELFATLSAGGKVILAENLLELPLLPAAQEVTLINTVPSGMAELLRMKGVPAGVVTVNLAGEPLPNSLAQDVYGLGHIERVYNLYGPTEDTTYSTYTLVARGATQNPAIGRPVSGTQAYIVDGHFRPVPIGVPGELYLGGAGLARGYYGRPDLTAERFMPNPLSDEPGARIYRTGDLARWLPDGQIEYLGRIDDQVKVRGFRIELGEVQEALLTCPGVSEAVVVARQQSLAAYFSAARDLTVQELRAHLGRRLPAYMIPAAFVQLAQMPHLPNGKVDRKALPAPTRERAEQAAAADTSVTTVTPVEQRLAAIWQRLLGLEQVGTHENFFDLGGHSLLIIRLRSAVEEEMGVTLPVTEFFKHPTVASLAARLTETAPAAAPSRRRRPAADEAVAIIGMACRFPQSPTLARYWANLRDGRECLTEAPGRGGERFVALGGYLEDIDKFDAAFFGISPREAEWMDPQHRIFLETVWAAMEDAGYLPDAMEAPVSLYAGVGHTDYFQAQPAGGVSQAEDWHAVQASRPGAMTTRVSYKLNLTGESLLVDTACSTSLVAVHMACRSLLDGSADYALAGGAAVPVPHKTGYEYEPGFILSPDGRCRAFDQQAAGTTVGSGVGVVFLKRLSEAVRDRDPIYAVIRGSAINNDGKLKAGYTAPSEQGQLEVILAALDAAGVDPDSIGMVEGHGTATPLGDPIEVRALTRAYRHFTNRAGYCALGSVKSNIGHADSAAGVAGLIKAALALHHGQIPPSLHFTAPNPELDLPGSPFYVPAALQPWARNGTPRRAAVSAFGIGGTNAHVILEEAPGKEA